MVNKYVILLVFVFVKISVNGQSDLNLSLSKFEHEVKSGYLEIETTFTNQNFILGNNGTVQCHVFFIVNAHNQICYILDYGSSIYILDANRGRLFSKTEYGFKEITDFTDPRQFNNLISFLLNHGYRKQIKQNAQMYDFVSETGDMKLWSLSSDLPLSNTFEVGFYEIYPAYVCSDILMHGEYQTSTQKVLKSKYNHLNQTEYDRLLQDYMVKVINAGVEN